MDARGRREMHTEFRSGNRKGRYYLGNQGVDGDNIETKIKLIEWQGMG
jgi:hypothetical protein